MPVSYTHLDVYKRQVLRDLHYAIIDEVDSVLIDEARTPLIISGQSGKSTMQMSVVSFRRVEVFPNTSNTCSFTRASPLSQLPIILKERNETCFLQVYR